MQWSMSCSALVRWQDVPSNELPGSFGGGPGSAASLGIPTRFKYWNRDYPAMLPEPATRFKRQDSRLQPHCGARSLRVVSTRRNVRAYSQGLIKSAASWAARLPSGATLHMRSFNLGIGNESRHQHSNWRRAMRTVSRSVWISRLISTDIWVLSLPLHQFHHPPSYLFLGAIQPIYLVSGNFQSLVRRGSEA
jgi:hypothetical protein